MGLRAQRMVAVLASVGTATVAGWRSRRADVVELAGFGSVGYGAWLVYVPAGWIVGGVLLALFAYGLDGGKG